jgi:predicted ATPase
MHLNQVIIHPEKYPVQDCYPFNLELFQKTENITFKTPVTFFVGENGSGKTTLLKAICRRCNIHIWEDTTRTRFQSNCYEDELYDYIDVDWVNGTVPGSFFSSQIFHDFARFLDEWAHASPGQLQYFGGSSLLTQSHGESMISYFEAMYRIKGIHFMDEPETALSPGNQIKLLKVIKEMSQAGHAQFIIASHSPILLAYQGATIYSFDSVPAKIVNYEDTEPFRIYKDFLNDRESYLK